jgi:hypothetical protein
MKAPTLARKVVPLLVVACSVLSKGDLAAQDCSRFTWSVSAAPAGGRSVAVSVCGMFAGCRPHNPQSTVDGSVIRVYLTQAELPLCMCIAVVDTFQITAIVPDVPPGDYTIEVIRVSCGEQEVAGTGTFAAGSASIPTLDQWGLAALVVLLAGAAVSRLGP